MPTKRRWKNRIIISVELSFDDNQRLGDIVKLAKLVNPKITQVEVIRKMICDLYSNLCRANLLPLPRPPAIIDVTASVGSNGRGEMPNGE